MSTGYASHVVQNKRPVLRVGLGADRWMERCHATVVPVHKNAPDGFCSRSGRFIMPYLPGYISLPVVIPVFFLGFFYFIISVSGA